MPVPAACDSLAGTKQTVPPAVLSVFALVQIWLVMPNVVDIRRSEDPRDVVHRACQILSEGGLIGLPTETQYTVAASVLQPKGMARLAEAAGTSTGWLTVKSSEEARDYLTDFPLVARKLIRRCWPGPVVLSFSRELMGGLYDHLPAATQSFLQNSSGRTGLRVPAYPMWHEIQRLLPAPLMMLTDDAADEERRNAARLVERWGNELDLVVDDGPCRYGEAATVVGVGAGGWNVESLGIVSPRHLGRLASEVYLFVCTGNTCRSPMAEAIFRKTLAERLRCAEDDLVDHGFVVMSAGLAASVGSPASRESVELLAQSGIDLRSHESQPLTERLLNQADHIFTLTKNHRQAILSERPDLESSVQTLAADSSDISDPIGAGRAAYESCKTEIERHIAVLVDRIALPK